jgi:hypothetical protein
MNDISIRGTAAPEITLLEKCARRSPGAGRPNGNNLIFHALTAKGFGNSLLVLLKYFSSLEPERLSKGRRFASASLDEHEQRA